MFRFWRYREFALLWTGQLGSLLGDSLFLTALVIYAYNATGSPTTTTEVFLASTAPRAILGTFAGVLADRVERRRLIIAADLARALTLLPLLAVHGHTRLWLLFPVTTVNACLGSVFQPAYSALLPATLPPEQLARGNAFNSATRATISIAGPPVGAAVLAVAGLAPLVLIDAVSFIGSVVTAWLIHAKPMPTPTANYRRHLADGIRVAVRHRVAAVLIATSTVMGLAGGMINAVIVPFFRQTLHASTPATGGLLSAVGLGAVLGGVLAAPLVAKVGARRATIASDVGCFATFIGVAGAPGLRAAAVAVALLGVTNGLYGTAMNTLTQTTVPADYLGRVYGTMTAAASAAALVATTVPVLLLHVMTVRDVLVVADVVAAVGAIVSVKGLTSKAARALTEWSIGQTATVVRPQTEKIPADIAYSDGVVTIRRANPDTDLEGFLTGTDDEQIDWLWNPGDRAAWQALSPEDQREHQRRHLEAIRDAFGPGPKWCFVGVAGADYVLYVDCDLNNPNVPAGQANISYACHPDFRSRGYTSRAVRLVLRFLTEHQLATRAHLIVHPDNAASLRVAHAVSATEVGRFFDSHGREMVRHVIDLDAIDSGAEVRRSRGGGLARRS